MMGTHAEQLGVTEVAGPFALRYDDVAQDGRITVHALPAALGAVTWPAIGADPRVRELQADGVLPILVRMQVRATEARISPLPPLRGAGRWRVWTARATDGSVDRIGFTMEVEVYGRPG